TLFRSDHSRSSAYHSDHCGCEVERLLMTNCKVAALLIFVGSACSAFAQTSVWLDVPFVKQPAEGCGAASIAMVMQYWEQHQNVGAQSLFGSGKSGDRKQSDVNHIQRELYSKPAH